MGTLIRWLVSSQNTRQRRIDMSALRAQYQGEGNTTRRIAEAESLHNSLHYINEHGLHFVSYLSKMQQMFTLFEENKEPYSNAMKPQLLYDTTKHPQLMNTVIFYRLARSPEMP